MGGLYTLDLRLVKLAYPRSLILYDIQVVVVVVVVVLNYYKKYSKFQYKLEIPYKYTVVLYSYIGGHRMVKIK